MWQYNYTQYPDELYHYGVKGMKWGVIKDKYHNSDGSLNKRGQKKVYKDIKKKRLNTDVLNAFEDSKFVDVVATMKAARDLGSYLTEHGNRSNKLSKKMQDTAWKNLESADSDWDKAYKRMTKRGKQIAQELLGTYKDKKIGYLTAEQKLLSIGEKRASEILDDYGNMIPYYVKYFE